VIIRTFQVGFGDCFLLSFRYTAGEKHVLIDFGTMALPDDVPKNRMVQIAEEIRRLTGGKLHAVVATHRHKDHISGFARRANGKGPGDIIRSLAPDVVVQPWTEHPDLARDAKKPAIRPGLRKRFGAQAGLRVSALNNMQSVAAHVVAASRRSRYFSPSLKRQLSFVGEDNLPNLDAVKNLMTMAPNNYVFTGSKSGLERVLPGVDINVLGPPTADQHPKIRSYARRSDEYWLYQSNALAATSRSAGSAGSILFPRHVQSRGPRFPVAARWLIYHARKLQGQQLLQIVRALDDTMNNTSVILLFGVGSKRLLFPGDAQVENWEFALKEKKDIYAPLLEDVDVYKVGHHGSLNATPKSLWKLFRKKSTDVNKAGRMRSLMSTLEDQHGESEETAVPRTTLVSALKRETRHLSTQQIGTTRLFDEFEFKF
jgi:hypothetical protein